MGLHAQRALVVVGWLVLSATVASTKAQSSTDPEHRVQDRELLEKRVAELRQQIQHTTTDASALQAHLELAMALQQLNHLSSDGGRRIPEAVDAYR